MSRRTSLWLTAAALGALLPTASRAADLPVKAVPVPVIAVYNWTGFYVGGHVGYGQGMKDWLNATFDYETRGFLGGGQIGYNQQVGNVVFGIEGDASWSDIKRNQAVTLGGALIGFTQTATGGTRVDGLATLTGRVGLAQDRWLVYVKGGAAWVHEKHNFDATLVAGAVTQTLTAAGSEDRLGLVVGIGSEWAFWGNWSFKSEYNYVHLGNRDVRLTGTLTNAGVATPFTQDVDLKQSLHLAKFGVNYRFGPDAPHAIAPARTAPGHNWTGAWVGAQAGYGWGGKHWPDFFPNDTFNTKGWLGGLTTGANVQAGVFVVGVESEWLYTDVKGGRRDVLDFGGGFTQTTDIASKVDWLWLNSVRVGFAAADKWLVYAKGGIAFAHEKHDLDLAQALVGVGSTALDLSGRALHTGYLAGVGVEYAFLKNWSAKLEYNYINFAPQDVLTSGPQAINIPPAQIGTIANLQRVSNITQDLHLVKFGINYHFDAFPAVVSAKY